MSHIATVSCKIMDLAALKEAAKELGGIFVENQKTYKWYGRSMGDAPLPAGMTVKDLGKCTHAIKLPGVNYEVGVVKQKDGSYTLAYDYFTYAPNGHDGGKLLEKFGPKLDTLTMLYSVHVATMQARARGWSVARQPGKNGAVNLMVTGIR